jgi:hypothetical protein
MSKSPYFPHSGAGPGALDREAELRKEIFFALSRMEKQRDAFSLVEMNGARCASRQMFNLHIYDRPQERVVGGGRTGRFV